MIASLPQRVNLRQIAEAVLSRDKNAVGVAHRRQFDVRIVDTRNMHEPGHCGEDLRLTGEMMMERVMDETECIPTANRFDRRERFLFGA